MSNTENGEITDIKAWKIVSVKYSVAELKTIDEIVRKGNWVSRHHYIRVVTLNGRNTSLLKRLEAFLREQKIIVE